MRNARVAFENGVASIDSSGATRATATWTSVILSSVAFVRSGGRQRAATFDRFRGKTRKGARKPARHPENDRFTVAAFANVPFRAYNSVHALNGIWFQFVSLCFDWTYNQFEVKGNCSEIAILPDWYIQQAAYLADKKDNKRTCLGME